MKVIKYEEASNNPEVNKVSADTLAAFMRAEPDGYLIVDCRFDYEYDFGHIKGAVNMFDCDKTATKFLNDRAFMLDLMRSNKAIVFHCEFSYERGPNMWRAVR